MSARLTYAAIARDGRIIQKTAKQLPRVEVYLQKATLSTGIRQGWRWRRRATNGKVTSNGAQSFRRPSDAVASAWENIEGPYLLEVRNAQGQIVKTEVTKKLRPGIRLPS